MHSDTTVEGSPSSESSTLSELLAMFGLAVIVALAGATFGVVVGFTSPHVSPIEGATTIPVHVVAGWAVATTALYLLRAIAETTAERGKTH